MRRLQTRSISEFFAHVHCGRAARDVLWAAPLRISASMVAGSVPPPTSRARAESGSASSIAKTIWPSMFNGWRQAGRVVDHTRRVSANQRGKRRSAPWPSDYRCPGVALGAEISRRPGPCLTAAPPRSTP